MHSTQRTPVVLCVHGQKGLKRRNRATHFQISINLKPYVYVPTRQSFFSRVLIRRSRLATLILIRASGHRLSLQGGQASARSRPEMESESSPARARPVRRSPEPRPPLRRCASATRAASAPCVTAPLRPTRAAERDWSRGRPCVSATGAAPAPTSSSTPATVAPPPRPPDPPTAAGMAGAAPCSSPTSRTGSFPSSPTTFASVCPCSSCCYRQPTRVGHHFYGWELESNRQ
jgi:hypothetical protein